MQRNLSRIYLSLGAICILTGAIIIGLAAYTFLVDDTVPQWVYVRPAVQSVPVTAGVEQSPEYGPLGEGPYRLVIDKLGVDAPVATFGLDENQVPQVPYERDVVAWYNFSSLPGTGNNAVFAGHKTWRGDAVFLELEELAVGDDIVLVSENGDSLIYRVSQTELVDPADQDALRWMQATETDSVTLITCGGEFFTNNTFAGADYTLRVIVRAERV